MPRKLRPGYKRRFLSFLPVILFTAIFCGLAPLSAQPDDKSYLEAKQFLKIFGHADDIMPGDSILKEEAAFLAQGPQMMPALIRLYGETKNDLYRSRVISLMRKMDGDKAGAVKFIEAELAKDPREWVGRMWLNMAVWLLGEVDKNMARKAYTRILEVDEDRGALLMATTMLKREGEPADIAALKRIIERRKHLPLSEGQTVDAVTFLANSAIKAIESRTQTTVSIAAASSQPTVSTPVPAASKSISAPSVGVEAPSRKWWLWGFGGALLLAIVIFVARRFIGSNRRDR